MSIIFGVLALLCFIYYVFAVSYAGFASSFLSFWLFCTIVFLLIAFAFKFIHPPKIIKVVTLIIFFIGVTIFAIVEGFIISEMNSEPDTKVDYLIVLGAQVRGEKVTKSLAKRLDQAIIYLNDNKDTKVIVSGGQGVGEDITEAAAMKRYLLAQNIEEERIILEDRSTSTNENLKFSYSLIENKTSKIGIVTNNFHVYRAVNIAEKIGIKNVEGLAAPSDNRLLLNYMFREFFAVVKAKCNGSI